MRISVESECGVHFSKGTLCSLCKLDWSASSVGWTDTVSFNMDIAARAQSIILERQGSVSLHLSMAGYPGNATFLDARVQQTWDPEDLSSRKSLPKGLRTPDSESSLPSYPSPVTPAEPTVPDLSLAFPVSAVGPSMPSLPLLAVPKPSFPWLTHPHGITPSQFPLWVLGSSHKGSHR